MSTAPLLRDATTWPPISPVTESKWDLKSGDKEALAASGDAGAYVEREAITGLHQTDTVDIMTNDVDEMNAVLELGEVQLKTGHSLVHRGTKYACGNRRVFGNSLKTLEPYVGLPTAAHSTSKYNEQRPS